MFVFSSYSVIPFQCKWINIDKCLKDPTTSKIVVPQHCMGVQNNPKILSLKPCTLKSKDSYMLFFNDLGKHKTLTAYQRLQGIIFLYRTFVIILFLIREYLSFFHDRSLELRLHLIIIISFSSRILTVPV